MSNCEKCEFVAGLITGCIATAVLSSLSLLVHLDSERRAWKEEAVKTGHANYYNPVSGKPTSKSFGVWRWNNDPRNASDK